MHKEDNDVSLLIPPEGQRGSPRPPPPPAVVLPVPCHCDCCPMDRQRPPPQKRDSSLNWKLVLLVAIASTALVSIVVISQQLIARHFGHRRRMEQAGGEPVTLELTIPETGWMSDEGLHHKLRYPGGSHQDYLVEIVQTSEMELDVPDTHTALYNVNTNNVLHQPSNNDHHEVKFQSPLTLENSEKVNLVENGMYWSEEVINNIHPGLDEEDLNAELNFLRGRRVARLEEPTWLKCGRDKNRFVTFSDGVHACARYREPHDQYVLGEVMSFYLARLLGITNIPAVVLSKVDPENPTWSEASDDVSSSGWKSGTIVALIQWIQNLSRDRMPDILRQALMSGTTLDVTTDKDIVTDEDEDVTHVNLRDLTVGQAAEMAQWSDMVIFDYLTANYDRVASMQDAAEKENRPEVLSETVHNLAKSSRTGSLWLIDNESGMLDAYNVLYPQHADPEAAKEAERFRSMHSQMLQTSCIFRKSTVDKIFSLYKNGDAATTVSDFVGRNEPLYRDLLKKVAPQTVAFRKHFQERVEEVWEWVKECQSNVRFW